MDRNIDRRRFTGSTAATVLASALAPILAVAHDRYSGMDAIGQAELVRRKPVTSRELVDAAIARIEFVNPKLNAVVPESSTRHAHQQQRSSPSVYALAYELEKAQPWTLKSPPVFAP